MIDVDKYIVDMIELYCSNKGIDRTIFSTVFDDALAKQGLKIEDHKLVKIIKT